MPPSAPTTATSPRAERFGSGARNYTVTYLVRDAAGNGRLVSGLVTVPPAGIAGQLDRVQLQRHGHRCRPDRLVQQRPQGHRPRLRP
jgi:hypothetical protein